MNFNKVILVGRLTRNPEVRVLPSGQQVATFGLASDRFYTDKMGQKQQKTEFHNIVTFAKLAEISSQYLKVGSLALIEGRLQTRSWQDAAGIKKYRTEIVAESLQLGPKPADRTAAIPGGQPAPTKIPAPQQTTEPQIPVIEQNDDIDVKNIPF
jgi:single-strand DNA-binding protein